MRLHDRRDVGPFNPRSSHSTCNLFRRSCKSVNRRSLRLDNLAQTKGKEDSHFVQEILELVQGLEPTIIGRKQFLWANQRIWFFIRPHIRIRPTLQARIEENNIHCVCNNLQECRLQRRSAEQMEQSEVAVNHQRLVNAKPNE